MSRIRIFRTIAFLALAVSLMLVVPTPAAARVGIGIGFYGGYYGPYPYGPWGYPYVPTLADPMPMAMALTPTAPTVTAPTGVRPEKCTLKVLTATRRSSSMAHSPGAPVT